MRRRKKDLSLETLLPKKIDKAIADYEAFTQNAVPEDAKGFMAYHQACKGALSHIMMLLKLMGVVKPQECTLPDADIWLSEAQTALSQWEDEIDEED